MQLYTYLINNRALHVINSDMLHLVVTILSGKY